MFKSSSSAGRVVALTALAATAVGATLACTVWLINSRRRAAATIEADTLVGAEADNVLASDAVEIRGDGPMAQSIGRKIAAVLAPVRLLVRDDSAAHRGHAGVAGAASRETHFQIQVVSDSFLGVPKLQRQQRIYKILDEEFAAGLHALELVCRTTVEEQRVSGKK